VVSWLSETNNFGTAHLAIDVVYSYKSLRTDVKPVHSLNI